MSRRRNRRHNPRQTPASLQPANQQALPKPTLPSEIDKAVRLQVQELLAVRSELFSGPLPHPDHLEAYERIMPGAAERIFQAFGEEAGHRHAMESKVVDSSTRLESRGQIFGFVIGMTALIGGIGLMALDKSLTGAATSLSALVTLVGVFVWSKRQKSRELSEKANPLTLGAELTPPPQLPDDAGRN